jgi:hypothetical protein
LTNALLDNVIAPLYLPAPVAVDEYASAFQLQSGERYESGSVAFAF